MTDARADSPTDTGAARPDQSLAAMVAAAADRAELGATAPALLLEIQSGLGSLSALAVEATGRGRRPFRPGEGWDGWLGRVAFDLFNLADQTGVDLDAAVRRHAQSVAASADRRSGADEQEWPFRAD